MSTYDNIMIMEDFNCKNVKWEDWSVERKGELWGGKLLRMAMDNLMTQWVDENTKFREDKPSWLDLIFTKESEVMVTVNYKSPISKKMAIWWQTIQ